MVPGLNSLQTQSAPFWLHWWYLDLTLYRQSAPFWLHWWYLDLTLCRHSRLRIVCTEGEGRSCRHLLHGPLRRWFAFLVDNGSTWLLLLHRWEAAKAAEHGGRWGRYAKQRVQQPNSAVSIYTTGGYLKNALWKLKDSLQNHMRHECSESAREQKLTLYKRDH